MLSSVFSCKHSLSPISKIQASLRIQEFDESLYLYVYQLFRCYLIVFQSAAMERTFLQKTDKNVHKCRKCSFSNPMSIRLRLDQIKEVIVRRSKKYKYGVY